MSQRADARIFEVMQARLPWGTLALDHDGAIVAATARAHALLGRPLPAGLPLAAVLGDAAPADCAALFDALEQGFEFETDEAILWLTLQPVEHDPAIAATVSVADVTPLRRALDERVASLRFLAHDLRSPQNSILALTQLHDADPDGFAACGGLERIGQLARHALLLGQDYLVASAADDLRQRHFVRFDLRAMLRELVPKLEVSAVYRGVALQLWLDDAAPLWLRGARVFVARALQNLIDNAVQASRQGARVEIRLHVRDAHAEVTIRDWAGGLPGLAADGRMTDFAPLAKRGSSGSMGFGLGLQLAAQVVAAHAGALYAESNRGVGTTFVMRVPVLAPAAGAAPRAVPDGVARWRASVAPDG
ncbi:HAMP domain-containing histidine kinase [Burkholderia humptydooensis]|uniref:histidine kinase n=3 Tax=Burkholderia humptydooensis TaxID=430531 RepID=A0A7U4PCB0_9BURK|nr:MULTISPECIES: HAMP domain-containing sensor histidine kinase [Burkholderia]AJY39665.1 histidine kinase-, DNA gyrase B-, and HSP90-like ATPase family protein [Burkholderia sp. 2002721687]ALX46944.1 histidine kinase [Burkholderia humptydooensis]EIP85753.1 sensor histidine kinase [Burkholderia humptydooensis MSMB43]QPS48052.1 HAMP domain-containing histidine kinase [Burkholderia humptydooensis]